MDYPLKSAGPALEVLSLVMLFVLTLAALAVVVYLAALPGKIAARRNHPQQSAVNICGWLGLLTGVGWVVAMVWAFWNFSGSGDSSSLASQIGGLEQLVAQLEKQQAGRIG